MHFELLCGPLIRNRQIQSKDNMDTEFTYIDRCKIYKKDMWRMSFVFQTISDEIKKANEKKQGYVTIGDTKIAIEGMEAVEKTWDVVRILEDRIRAASRLLSTTLPTDVHFLDLDYPAEVKRIQEERDWKAKREEDYQKQRLLDENKAKKKAKKKK